MSSNSNFSQRLIKCFNNVSNFSSITSYIKNQNEENLKIREKLSKILPDIKVTDKKLKDNILEKLFNITGRDLRKLKAREYTNQELGLRLIILDFMHNGIIPQEDIDRHFPIRKKYKDIIKPNEKYGVIISNLGAGKISNITPLDSMDENRKYKFKNNYKIMGTLYTIMTGQEILDSNKLNLNNYC